MTPKDLYVITRSIILLPIWIGRSKKMGLCRKFISISLHFLGSSPALHRTLKGYSFLLAFLTMYSIWGFHFRSLLKMTPKDLYVITRSIILLPIWIGRSKKMGLCRKFISISLHFLGLSFMLCSLANSCISCRDCKIKEAESSIGIISRPEVSSTNFVRRCQLASKLFVMTIKSTTPSLVPWGIPPFRVCHWERTLPILTACLRLNKNAEIQDSKAGWTCSLSSSCTKIEWSIWSKPQTCWEVCEEDTSTSFAPVQCLMNFSLLV